MPNNYTTNVGTSYYTINTSNSGFNTSDRANPRYGSVNNPTPPPTLQPEPVGDAPTWVIEEDQEEEVDLGALMQRASDRPRARINPIRVPPSSSGVSLFTSPVGIALGKQGFAHSKDQSWIALELENESEREFQFPRVRGWNFHNEGSLRYHGFEYVSELPWPVDKVGGNVAHLLKEIKKNAAVEEAELTNSSRTSTHVHFDITKHTYLDLVNFVCLYWMFEEFLSHFAGETRKANLFCLRLKDSTAMCSLLEQEIHNLRPYSSNVFDENMRYASVNLAAVSKFGSLEFRMMRGTDSVSDIMTWVHALDAIKQYALKFKTPLELRKHFIDTDAGDLPIMVFGVDLFNRLSAVHPSVDKYTDELRRGFLSVSQLLTCHKSFDFTEEIKAEEERKKKEQEEYERAIAAENERHRRHTAAMNSTIRVAPEYIEEPPQAFIVNQMDVYPVNVLLEDH